MRHSALVKIALLVGADDLLNLDSVRAGRTLYRSGSLRLQQEAPLVVDHERRIGVVQELVKLTDPETLRQWMFARCAVEEPPPWLRSGTPASFSFVRLQPDQEIGSWHCVQRALVTEVTVCSAAYKPVDSSAKVALLQRVEPAAEVIIHGGGLIRRPGIGRVVGIR
jgi:hypothetical protein